MEFIWVVVLESFMFNKCNLQGSQYERIGSLVFKFPASLKRFVYTLLRFTIYCSNHDTGDYFSELYLPCSELYPLKWSACRNSSTFHSFSETRLLFWTRLRLRGYPATCLLPFFREINYSKRKKCFSKTDWMAKRRGVVFKTSFNCSHVVSKKLFLNTCQALVQLLVNT